MGEEQCGDSVPYTCQELRGADYKTERCHRGRYIRCRKPREVEHKNYCERPNLMFGEGKMKKSCCFHVCCRFVFWTNWGMAPFIGRVGMDGSGVRHIITAGLVSPSGISVDYQTNTVWWSDIFHDRIE